MLFSRTKVIWRVWSALSVLTLVVVLSACGSGGGNTGTGSGAKGPTNALIACPRSTNTTAAAPESGNITLTVAGWTSSPAEDKLVTDALAIFHQQNPNITLNWTPIPGDYATKMRANIASNNVPDIFYVQPPMAQEYVKAGKLLNLSPYLTRDNMSPSDYFSSLLTPFDCADGSVYGIPKDWNALGLFYNKTMFQQAGVGDPSNWSWSDLQSAAQKLTSGNVVGLSLPPDASRWGAFLYANGGQMLSKDGKSAAFNNQAGIDAAKYYTNFQLNKIGARPGDIGAGWDGEAFGKQVAAMTFEGGWMIPYLAQTFPTVQYGIAPVPSAPNGKRGNLLYTNAWGISSSSQHPDAAWKLLKYLTGKDNQTTVLHAGFALSTLKSLGNDAYFTQNPGVKVLSDGADYGYADFYGAADTEVHNEVGNALQAVMLGKSSVTDAMNAAAQNVNNWIQQNVGP